MQTLSGVFGVCGFRGCDGSICAPTERSRSSMVWISTSSGRLWMHERPGMASVAARMGSEAFLLPLIRTLPESGVPPWIRKSCCK